MSYEEIVRKTIQNIAINDRLIRESKARLESISNQLNQNKNETITKKENQNLSN